MDCAPFILGIHYARRWPSISHAFGLYRDEELVGVVTYGTPPSAPLRNGIAGAELAGCVLELNRLCLRDNLKNEASRLVGASLRKLPKRSIVISFADTEQDHKGIVYQACSFTYHGLSAKRTDWKIKGKEHLHGQTVADEFRGQENRAALMRAKYGEDFYLAPARSSTDTSSSSAPKHGGAPSPNASNTLGHRIRRLTSPVSHGRSGPLALMAWLGGRLENPPKKIKVRNSTNRACNACGN